MEVIRVVKEFEGADSREVYRAMNRENMESALTFRQSSWEDAWVAYAKQDGKWVKITRAPKYGTVGSPGPMGISTEVVEGPPGA